MSRLLSKPRITFATAVWENDWRHILKDPKYLPVNQIANHLYPFDEKLLIINNVNDLNEVIECAEKLVERGILTRYVIADDILSSFDLKKEMFNDWQYYNAIAPLSAIYHATGDYLLYQTGDVYLKNPVQWISKALRFMRKRPEAKVANLIWNENKKEVKRESDRTTWNFYVAKKGFSDQMFLVKRSDFLNPIYGEIHRDSHHFPRGDVFEKRVFSFMLNHGWERITYKHGSYIHENIKVVDQEKEML